MTPASCIRGGAANLRRESVEVDTSPPFFFFFNSKQITAAFLILHWTGEQMFPSSGHHYSYDRKFSFFPSTKNSLKATRKGEPTQLVLLARHTLLPSPSPWSKKKLLFGFSVTPHTTTQTVLADPMWTRRPLLLELFVLGKTEFLDSEDGLLMP